ncbi:MFS transporter [Penicillium macrosclerotiorum]|uniref:MFS transporter n=1 Tax=Penicillium macrosclerotiorum TaxID=303699 RepID=UPI002549A2EC|nr:MFS transporter [Penicillium macrosclerotiorum]KAJ5690051.1 MFS transporter [Penicillium macrosclerotiorum]
MEDSGKVPWGYQWRSSPFFIIGTVCVALFIEIFLYGFLVPILPYMLENRLHVDPSQTQRFTSISLALHGLMSAFGGPLIGHFADKAADRRTPLLVALVGCIIGTAMVACGTSLVVFFTGRVLQGISGSGAWIVGLATAADTVGQDRVGTIMGIIMSFVNAGMIVGPMVSGLILETAGYWLTWTVPVVILIIDIVARLLMIEIPRDTTSKATDDAAETDSLLSQADTPTKESLAPNFWRIMLGNSRVITVLLITIWGPCLGTTLNATLPLYVQETFGWGPSRTGLLFFLIAAPGLLISALAGWLRDRIGTRLPATTALIFQGGCLVLLGFAGNVHFKWSSAENRGQALYISAIIILGMVRPFLSGIGPVELTSIVKIKEEQSPGVFGPRGGYSRVFSIVEVAATTGMTIGPLISGCLVERFGYAMMNWSFSLSSVLFAVLAFIFLGSKKVNKGKSKLDSADE